MDREAQLAHIAATQEAARRAINDHTEKAYLLETGLGFDLNVATDIYGLALLEPSKESGALLESWRDLLEKIAGDENQIIAVVQQYTEPRPGCRGFGGDPGDEHHLRVTFIRDARTDSVSYFSSFDGTQSRILLSGVSSATIDTGHADRPRPRDITWSEEPIVLAAVTESSFALFSKPDYRFQGGLLGPLAPPPAIYGGSSREVSRALRTMPTEGWGYLAITEAVRVMLEEQTASS